MKNFILISLSLITTSLIANSSNTKESDSNLTTESKYELIKKSIKEYESINKNLLIINRRNIDKSNSKSLTEVGYSNCAIGYKGTRNSVNCVNKNLKNLRGWKDLLVVNKTLNLSHNKISNLSGLDNLNYLGGLNLSNNYLLDFNINIPKIEGDINLEKNILTNISGLNTSKNIIGKLNASHNKLLKIDGFKNLISINGIDISNNAITKIPGFNKLKVIFGDLHLENNKLESIYGFNNLMSIEGDFIAYRNKITTLKGFKKLSFVKGDINLLHNNLINLDGFDSLKTVSKSLNVSNNRLSNIKSLSNLNYVGSNLNLSFNNLVNLSGLENLFVVKGNLYLNNLPINDLTAIKGLSYIGGNFSLRNNENLENLSPLNNLVMNKGSKLILDDKDFVDKLSKESFICKSINDGIIYLSGPSINNICEVN